MRKLVGTILTAIAGVVGVGLLAAPQAAADSPWDQPGPNTCHEHTITDDSPWD
jgi:hypothetical protein